MVRVIAVVSHKGGTGKTSLVQNLGAELARADERVLLVDFDPQSNLSTGWGVDPDVERHTVYQAMLEPARAAEAVLHVRPGMDLIPASLDLAGAELAFINAIDRNNKLKKALAPLLKRYDVVLIDTPPSLGFFTVNALAAASEVLIPLQVQVYAYKALDQVLPIIEQVKEINPQLRLSGIVLTMYDTRNALTGTVEEMARRRFGDLVLTTPIPINVRIAEAPLDGISVGEYEANSRGAQAYRALAQEVLGRG
jgi:chromosome partitioning protein